MGEELFYCLHRNAAGEYDCGVCFRDPERRGHRLCPKHRAQRVRLPPAPAPAPAQKELV